jgi:hypothetical protein
MFSKQKIAQRLFDRYKSKRESDSSITARELKEIQQLYVTSLVISAFIGVLFVLLFYLPIYMFPSFFNENILKIQFWGLDLEIRWIRELDNFLLTYVELYFLSILSIYMIQRLAMVLDFPSMQSKHYQLHLQNIQKLSLEVKQKKEAELGLDPFLGLSRVQLYVYLLISRFKAMFSNMLIKFLLQRFASRYLLKTVIDMVGAPIYAFWNAYATAKLFKDSKYYIFSVEITDMLAEKLQNEQQIKEEISREIQHLLVSVVALKRDYSEINHYFSSRLLESLQISMHENEYRTLSMHKLLEESDPKTVQWVSLLFATGIILDGNISRRERKSLRDITQDLNFKEDALTHIDEYLSAYRRGQGVAFIQLKGWI